VNQILDFECNEISGLNLQTRAKIVLGLTFYQLGNYEETRKAYNQVLLLAKAENNEALSLEVKIMLSFLDVWEGKSDSELSEDIITSIEKMPIKTQPLMLLNLIFYWILGEKFELNTGITILEKIKCLNQKLCWSFLKPLINDIEARILRFSKEYDKAIICHKSALECLSKNSFEYLQANLNFALTLVKMNKKEEAKEILEKNIERANQVKAKGILREMQVILEQIMPQNSTYKINTTAWIPLVNPNNELKKVTTEKESLKINLFDGLKITLGDRKIDKWSRKKSKNVLIYLLFKPNGIHRETLADLVFFTDELDNPLKNLDVSIHSLRKALEPERKVKESSFILFKDSCYIFNWANPHTLDLNDFELNYKVWKKSLTSNLAEAISTSSRALELYQGALLPEIDFAELWIEEKEETKRKALAMSNFLTEHYLKENDFELAETYANKAIFIDNLAEETYIALMKIAEKRKDPSSLKNTYERMLYTFKKEFDDLPSPETILTYKTILQKICK
jgi:two-component SAPR family response regulator